MPPSDPQRSHRPPSGRDLQRGPRGAPPTDGAQFQNKSTKPHSYAGDTGRLLGVARHRRRRPETEMLQVGCVAAAGGQRAQWASTERHRQHPGASASAGPLRRPGQGHAGPPTGPGCHQHLGGTPVRWSEDKVPRTPRTDSVKELSVWKRSEKEGRGAGENKRHYIKRYQTYQTTALSIVP